MGRGEQGPLLHLPGAHGRSALPGRALPAAWLAGHPDRTLSDADRHARAARSPRQGETDLRAGDVRRRRLDRDAFRLPDGARLSELAAQLQHVLSTELARPVSG